MSRPVKCQSSKHALCVVCHWANWSLGLMSRHCEHKHSNWEVNWVTGMSTQARKHWEEPDENQEHWSHFSGPGNKDHCMRKKKKKKRRHRTTHTYTLRDIIHNSTHNLCNEARVIQLCTSKRWAESFLLDFNPAVHKAKNAFQWRKSQVWQSFDPTDECEVNFKVLCSFWRWPRE